VAAIYNEGIAGRQATFETRPREPAEIVAWLAEDGPLLVAVEGEEVLGWARVTAYSDRCVYTGIGEYAVYVAGAARGRGVGRELLEALCRAAEARGHHKLVGRMFASNRASRELARAAGFRELGVERRHGRLDGEWRDCVPVERLLGEAAR
jgi:phosphinothricin acetyltransferase